MATAYSSLLGLALPVQGDLTGQWGNEVNDYITKYLDASVAGGLAITADVTLTKTTGSALGATSSQYAILTCSPASVNIVVTAPAAYKIYVVNNTSASYTVTIRGAGPTTGVVLSALEKAVVAWNGTDFFKVATSATDGVSTFSAGSTGLTPSSATSGAVTLAGTLAVLNGGTGVTTSTGTTNVVLSNSPTLVAPNLGSPASVGTMPAFTLGGTVSGGGNQINNVVIGTSTPLAGSFTTLSATGTLSGGTSGTAYSFSGSAPATSLTLTSAGLLGIGTNTPVAPLAVSGSAITMGYFISSAAQTYIEMDNSGGGGYIGTTGNAIVFLTSTGGTERMRLDSSGNLGIGTSSPAYRLDVAGEISQSKTSNTTVATGGFDASTSWGLKIANASTTAGTGAGIYFLGGTNSESYIGNLYDSAGAGALSFQTRVAGTRAERMRIDSSGNLLVGATSANSSAHHLLQYSDDSKFAAAVVNSSASTNAYGLYIYYSALSPNSTGSEFFYCADSSAVRATMRSNGGIANYSANNANLSDRREKTNFAPAGSYLDKICAIPVQTFNYIDQNLETDAGLTLGVVAQDVQAVAPELVMESNWARKDDEPKMRLSIYQTDLQYALMKCIQEQQALITQLTARITALETA
jgi:hypothetical protein